MSINSITAPVLVHKPHFQIEHSHLNHFGVKWNFLNYLNRPLKMLLYSEVSNRGTETQIVMASNSKAKEHVSPLRRVMIISEEKNIHVTYLFVCFQHSQQLLETMWLWHELWSHNLKACYLFILLSGMVTWPLETEIYTLQVRWTAEECQQARGEQQRWEEIK